MIHPHSTQTNLVCIVSKSKPATLSTSAISMLFKHDIYDTLQIKNPTTLPTQEIHTKDSRALR